MLTLLLVACAGTPEITLDDTGGGKDSGNDSVDPIEDPTFTFTFTGNTAGRALLVQYMDDMESWITGDVASTQALSGSSLSIHLDEPPESARTGYPEYPDTEFAFAPAAVFEDEDADGEQDYGEIFVANDVLLLWIGGAVVPDAFELAGAEFGWNAMAVSSLGGTLATFDPLAVPVTIEEPQTSVTLSGTYAGNTEDIAVIVVPLANGGVVTSYLGDSPLDGDTFTVALAGEPPADHFTDDDGDGFSEAGEYLASYADVAQPPGYGSGDVARYPACVDGQAVIVYWLDGFDDLARATVYSIYGFGPAWNVLSTNGSDLTTVVSPDDYDALTMSSDCTFG